jgi:Subtilase family
MQSVSSNAGSSASGLILSRCAVALAAAIACSAHAAPQAQGNLGLGLRQLVAFQQAEGAARPAADLRAALDARFASAKNVVLDAAGRVQVDVHLNGRVALADVKRAAQPLDVQVFAETTRWRHGVISAYVPIAQAAALAQLPGVKAVLMAAPPVADIGKATSQGTEVIRSDKANAQGSTGAGVTVGALSDSYDGALRPKTTARQDVRSGDLPGVDNPNGFLDPVVVLKDFPLFGLDEGRGMLQIVHDVAPGARLCFATANSTPTAFANNIRALADKGGRCGADVIVDDILYLTEPMFSDGLIAQAVDEVVGGGASYFASAGNRASSQGYRADFEKVSNSAARAGSNTVDLSLIPSARTPGGFHNFNPGGATDIAQTVELPVTDNRIVFQWTDPFDAGGVTTDYDIYVFSANGNTLVASSDDDNVATDQPVELVTIPQAGTYQIVFARADSGAGAPTAKTLRYVNFGEVIGGEYQPFYTPVTYGHNSAAGAVGTAAVAWYQSYIPEYFSSPGPSLIHFDADGNRLAEVEVREKPDLAAPDGGNTTHFISDTDEDTDNLPNFFGTSAAAPHAAAVAALVIEKAGGPGSITPKKIRQVLRDSAGKHDLAPFRSVASASAGAATVKLEAVGDGTPLSTFNPNAFRVSLSGPAGYTLKSLTIDLAGANAQRVFLGVPSPGMQFDPRPDGGFPFTLGELNGVPAGAVSIKPLAVAPPFSQQLTVKFADGTFGTSEAVSFGIDRDETARDGFGASMDLIAGGRIEGTVVSPSGKNIAFSARIKPGRTGAGYSVSDGYGLIDAVQALKLVP